MNLVFKNPSIQEPVKPTIWSRFLLYFSKLYKKNSLHFGKFLVKIQNPLWISLLVLLAYFVLINIIFMFEPV